MKIKSKLVAAALLTAAATIGPVSTLPAQAADYYIWVCNDPRSDDNITAWSNSPYYRISINQGVCKTVTDRGGNARLDVAPAGGEADIDSYIIWTDYYPFGGSPVYGPCYNSENGASNPSSTGGKTSHYWTSKYSCGSGV
jgi:hypothetical protein